MLCRRSHKHLFDDAVPMRADHDQVDVLFVGDTQNLSIRFARLDALIHAGVLARLPSYSAAQVALRGLGPRADMADAVHAIDPERQVLRHFDDPSKGVVDSRNLVYYVSLMVFGLFATMRSIESVRWKA